MTETSSTAAVKALMDGTAEDTKKILAEIIKIENAKIHEGSPYGVHKDILEAVKRIIP